MRPMDIHWDRLDPRAWAAALPDSACAMQHSWRYGAAVTALGRQVNRAEIWQGGRFYGLAQVVTRRAGPLTLGLLSRGPVWLDAAPADPVAVHGALRRGLPGAGRGPRGLIVTAESPADGARLLPLVTPVCLAELALGREPGAMRAAMHGKWRNHLARAERAGLKTALTIPTADDLAWLLTLDRAQARARGCRGLPPAFLGAWAAQKGPPMRLWTARQGAETVAAMLFLDHPPGVTYQIGWTGAAGRAACAHHLLLWQAIRHFGRNGRRRLDLGPLDTVTAPGLARFKLGAGARPRWLGATGLVLPWGRKSAGAGRAASGYAGRATVPRTKVLADAPDPVPADLGRPWPLRARLGRGADGAPADLSYRDL